MIYKRWYVNQCNRIKTNQIVLLNRRSKKKKDGKQRTGNSKSLNMECMFYLTVERCLINW